MSENTVAKILAELGTLRVRAETTKTRRERVVPDSAPTGVLCRSTCGTGRR